MLLASNSRNATSSHGVAGLSHDILRRSLADKALRYATQFWFSVMVLGQWIFAAYIVAVYGRSAAAGDFAKWNQTLPHGWEAGNNLGNTVLAAHLMFGAAITTAGALQLIPSLRSGFPAVHRWVGRAYILSAFLMAGSGLYLSWSGRKVVGDTSQHVAVELSAFLILAFATLALLKALQRQFVAHRRWALRLFLVVNGGWFFRITLMFWMAVNQRAVGFDPDKFVGPFLTLASFGEYLVPLALLELYFRAQSREAVRGKWALAATFSLLTLASAIGIFAATQGLWLPRV
jgi:Predicted membrane protein (DUF2306)